MFEWIYRPYAKKETFLGEKIFYWSTTVKTTKKKSIREQAKFH